MNAQDARRMIHKFADTVLRKDYLNRLQAFQDGTRSDGSKVGSKEWVRFTQAISFYSLACLPEGLYAQPVSSSVH